MKKFNKHVGLRVNKEMIGLKGEPTMPDPDDVKTKLPPPRFRICGMAATVITVGVRT